MDKQFSNEVWHHGLLPREDIKGRITFSRDMMLRTNGDFLVRTTEPVAGKPRALVLSVMVRQEFEDQGIKHFVITVIPFGKVMIEKYAFESVSSMIGYHLSKKESITK
ncbi:hypothetical protein Angca_002473, partial [Angiostrongylus cantonensis]